ncbi:MAG: cyclopropane-fatty-acyl-phospholipid synthase family protein [Pseudomonadota bacterium]
MSVSTEFNSTILVDKSNFSEKRRTIPFVARKAFDLLVKVEKGKLLLQLPGGERYGFDSGNPGPEAHIVLNNWHLPRKVITGGTIGAAESYMNGDWDSPDATQMLEFFLKNRSIYEDVATQNLIINLVGNIRHWLNRNSRNGSKRNIAAHYDLGNDFYSLWLDPSMTYSSAIYEDGANSLERAQEDKYRSLAKNMGITPESHVLEIGCGWGGFAEFVTRKIGARVTGLTISQEQLNYARQRIQKAGLQEKAEFRFQDYRDETGKYDQIASIEMFEAVGEQYWPTYFNKVRDCLKPGGTAGLQIITIQDSGFENYRKRADFIQRYIFPGGMLPSPSALQNVTSEQGLKLAYERIFPQDYVKTLEAWRLKFWEKWDDVRKLGFDERFKRMWEFYFHYCEAGFKTESIDVRQMFYKHS